MVDKKDIENLGYRESIEGLPEELLKALAITRTKPIDQELVEIVKSFDGVATLDEIMIRRYRRTQEVPDRQYLNNRLLNLVKRKMLIKVPKTKAVYSLPDSDIQPTSTLTPSSAAKQTSSTLTKVSAEQNSEKDDVAF